MKNARMVGLVAQHRFLNLRGVAAAALFLGAVSASGPARAQNFFASGPAPSFTAAQAARGKTAYDSACSSCHGGNLDDGQFAPPLKGSSFQKQWAPQSAAALFTYMIQKMPPVDPGALGNQAYADMEAYILQANGLAPGAKELTAAQLTGSPEQNAGAQQGKAAPKFQPDVRQTMGNHDATYKAVMAQRQAELQKITPVTNEMLEQPSNGDWLMWRRTYSGIGFSPLDQIDKSNVSDLRLDWSLALPLSANEITPVVHDGVIFIESGSTVLALDGSTGALLWKYVRPLGRQLLNGTESTIRGLAIYQDKLIVPTADGHVIALDVHSGKLLWDHEVVVPMTGVYTHSNRDYRVGGPPIVVHGKVLIGVSLGIANPQGGCFIVGLDADTGKELWRFHTIARPGQPGGDSWNGAPVDQRFGASEWTTGSYDPKRNLVYFGTGNTYDIGTLLLPHPQKGKSNDALYTESTLALDPDTGKLRWYFQHMNRDIWDLDWTFDQLLVTLPVHGKPTDLVVTAGKMALYDALNRSNGRYEFSKDLGIENLVQSIDPKTGKKNIYPKFDPVADKTYFVCPSANGARNWPADSYDPATHILYVALAETCMNYSWHPRSLAETAKGGLDIRYTIVPVPHSDGKMGQLDAVNLETRKIVWRDRQRAPFASAMLSTAGGLVFAGSQNREFTAYDSATGKALWHVGLNATPSSYPISYGIGGREYIAVVSGGGSPLDASGHSLAPELDDPAGGTTLWVFRLPRRASGPRQ